MGILRFVQYEATRSSISDYEASLATLIADRAAGRNVDESDIRFHMRKLDHLRREITQWDAEVAREERDRERRENDSRQQQARRSDEYEARRRDQEDRRRQYARDAQEQRGQQQEALRAEIAAHAETIHRVLQLKETDDDQELLAAVFFACSLLDPEDARLLGEDFSRTRDWIMDGHDPSGAFLRGADEAGMDPENFADEILYREAVAMATCGQRLLQQAFSHWPAQQARDLRIAYPDWRAQLPSVCGPFETSRGETFVHCDSSRRALRFFRLDRENWRHEPLFSLPLPEDLTDGDCITNQRASNYWCFDETARWIVVGVELYEMVQDSPRHVRTLDLSRQATGLDLDLDLHRPSRFHVRQQIVTHDGRPLWLVDFDEGERDSKRILCFDLMDHRLLWKDQADAKSLTIDGVGQWLHVPTRGAWYGLHAETLPQEAPKRSMWNKLLGTAEPPARPVERTLFVARDVLTGRPVASTVVADMGMGFTYSLFLDDIQRIHYISGDERSGHLDVDGHAWHSERAPHQRNPTGPVGATRLFFLEQLLRHHGGTILPNGGLAPSLLRLASAPSDLPLQTI